VAEKQREGGILGGDSRASSPRTMAEVPAPAEGTAEHAPKRASVSLLA
jgi:hypothetical protein